jgi:hypothetical protein
MPCPEKIDLVVRYKIKTAAYAYAVSELARSVRIGDEAGFGDLVRLSQDARRLSNDAGDNFAKHFSSHGC